MAGPVLISRSQSQLSFPLRNIVDRLLPWTFLHIFFASSLSLNGGVEQYQPGHKSSFPHLRDVMWTPKNQKQASSLTPEAWASFMYARMGDCQT